MFELEKVIDLADKCFDVSCLGARHFVWVDEASDDHSKKPQYEKCDNTGKYRDCQQPPPWAKEMSECPRADYEQERNRYDNVCRNTCDLSYVVAAQRTEKVDVEGHVPSVPEDLAEIASFSCFPIDDDTDNATDECTKNTPATKHRLAEDGRDDATDCHKDTQNYIHRHFLHMIYYARSQLLLQ